MIESPLNKKGRQNMKKSDHYRMRYVLLSLVATVLLAGASANADVVFGTPTNLGPMVNSSARDEEPGISNDGLSIYYCSLRSGGYGGYDMWVTTRATTQDDWGPPVNLGPTVNSSSDDFSEDISADGLSLILVSARAGGYGGNLGDLWLTRRPSISGLWGPPVNLGPIVNGSNSESGPCLSADGSMLYFSSDRTGGSGAQDMWQVSISPVVDLNGDGVIEINDLVRLIESWGKDDPSVDIGPGPWGDGIVDVEDLKVLAEHLFKNVSDPTLVAHWGLDETEGGIAYDSAGLNDASVIGGALWQPGGGQVDGAIQLDGVDDAIIAGAPLNPADGPLSVFAWINGGAPGQAIISEPGGPDWLSLDPTTGCVMTELTSTGRNAVPLFSQTAINDGTWHRIGLVWDGAIRTLFVDGVAVAEDAQNRLESPANGFYIGTGKAMAPGTYFSGLIDDVRIYSRAVKP
jgi:hypothetical protein